MQNKANFRKRQMNVTDLLTREYEKMDTWWSGKKQSQTNPIKAKFNKAKMNVTSILTVGYENKLPIRAPKKQSQTSKQQKPMQTSLPQRIMKKTALSVPGKTKPNKANFRGKKILLRLTINTRRKSRGYYADEIEAPNAYDREKAGNRINSISAVDLLHSTEQRAKICTVFRFDRLILT